MQYRKNPKNKDMISQLAFGCMRFPRAKNKIDQKKTNELIAYAIEQGVNFFDTAYIYPGSEEALGIALETCGKRDGIKIATKLPHYLCKAYEDFDKHLNIQLKRLKTDYIDYYFIHMINNLPAWERVKSMGIEKWITQKKQAGIIKNIGFSFHGGALDFIDILNDYDWEFTMVQYNYFDVNNQAGRSGVEAANKKELPVFVMEPLRGGQLAGRLPEDAIEPFKKVNPSRPMAEWALRWLYNQPEVTMALSGMSNMHELKENLAASGDAVPGHLSFDELAAYKGAVAAIKKVIKIPCTSCGYCMPCPKGVDIPTCFNAYNESYSIGFKSAIGGYLQNTGLLASDRQTDASRCIKCKKCEQHCPQKIEIASKLMKVKRRMKTAFVKPVIKLVKRFM